MLNMPPPHIHKNLFRKITSSITFLAMGIYLLLHQVYKMEGILFDTMTLNSNCLRQGLKNLKVSFSLAC